MRAFNLIIFLVVYCDGEKSSKYFQETQNANILEEYQKAVFDFMVPLFKSVAYHSNVSFFFSPRSVWMTLFAIAEGSKLEIQQHLLKLLHLPDNAEYRQKYYQIMNSSVTPTYGFNLEETKKLFVDKNINVNPAWMNFVSNNFCLDIINTLMQNNPEFTDHLKVFTTPSVPIDIDFSSNSMLLETFDFNGLWTTAFEDAVVENSPFYNQQGEEIGFVDFMKVKRKARMGYVRSLNAKLLEVPLGAQGKYRMLFYIILDKQDVTSVLKKMNNDIVLEMFHSLKESNVPIDIAIPRFKITTEIDMRKILEDLVNISVSTDSESTIFISTPGIFPTSYLQRASFTLNKYGIAPSPAEKIPLPGTPTGLDPEVGTDFIANQPLFFGLFEAETYTPLIGAGISTPTTYKYATTYVRKM